MGQSAKNVKNFEVQVDFRWEIKFFLEKSTLRAAINCKVFDQSRKTFICLKGFDLLFIFFLIVPYRQQYLRSYFVIFVKKKHFFFIKMTFMCPL